MEETYHLFVLYQFTHTKTNLTKPNERTKNKANFTQPIQNKQMLRKIQIFHFKEINLMMETFYLRETNIHRLPA